MDRVDKLKQNLSSQLARTEELAKIRATLAESDAVVKLRASDISDMDKQFHVLGFSEKAKATLPLELFTTLVHKAALELHRLCLQERHLRAEEDRIEKFSEVIQALLKASFMKELHGRESEEVLKDR